MPDQYVGKTYFVAGGSSGLGKSIAELLAEKGAHVTVFGRRAKVLEETRLELQAKAVSPDQQIRAVVLDLLDPEHVEKTFKEQPTIPDVLYCVAGGCIGQLGYFTDVTSKTLKDCMEANYLTSAYPAHTMIKNWIEDDKVNGREGEKKVRRLVFVNSASALCNIPGYIAYAAPKSAQRSLADTLRLEAFVHETPTFKYTVHCAFPNTFMTDAFIEDQKTKPKLTMRIEGSDQPAEKLKQTMLDGDAIAKVIVKEVTKGEFAILSDFDAEVLWSNMTGMSPKRGWGIVDTLLAPISNIFIWPVLRWMWAGMARDARKKDF